jgi:hypothetical protein
VLDELVVLGTEEGQLGHAAIAVEHSELDPLVAHEHGPVVPALDAHARPGIELVGALVDEGGGPGRAPIRPVVTRSLPAAGRR